MMPILIKTDDVRSGRKAKVHHGRLWLAQESMGLVLSLNSYGSRMNFHVNSHHDKMQIFLFLIGCKFQICNSL